MRIIVCLFFCVLSLQGFATTQAIPAEKQPLVAKSLLLDITRTSNNTLVAVGEHGNIIVSSDGTHWVQANVPVQSTLTALYFVGTKGWAVGHDNVILTSVDGGMNWTIQRYQPEIQKPLLDVVFFDENHGIAVGAYGQFYRTQNGGKNWTYEFHDELLSADDADYLNELKQEDELAYQSERDFILPHFNRVFKDGRTLYLVGELGLIAKSNDSGQHWERLDEIYTGSFFDIGRTQQGNLLVIGLRGHIFRSLQNGTPWQTVEVNTTALLNSIVLTDDNRILVLGNNGVLLVSDDDGASFQQYSQPDGKALIAGVWYNNRLIVVSDVGVKTIKVK
jgi:photosystem II stability/assembly factor-like uncharacterized protein